MNQQGLVISQPEMVIPTLQSSFKVMFKTRDDSQRRFLEQHGVAKLEHNAVTIRNNVPTMLQRCVALKIVVADRLL